MRQRSRAAALLVAAGLVISLVGPLDVARGQEAGAQHQAAAQAAQSLAVPTFRQAWTHTAGGFIAESSPVVVNNGGNPFVVAGGNSGDLRAFDLDTGAVLPGWGQLNAGAGSAVKPQVRAPLSSDGTSVYVPVAQDGLDRYPLYRKYSRSGALLWSSNPTTRITATGGFLLSGLTVAWIGSSIRGFGGSSGQWIWGVDASGRGGQLWGVRNADSTMATPAVADLYGSGRPQVITSSDTSAEFSWDRNGGILRILTYDGKQICTATQLVSGSTYASSGYNNSSPAVAQVNGRPLIVFGSTGPTQYGVGGNQVVGYDAGCGFKWATPDLGGQARTSPTFADVLGTGKPQVLQLISMTRGDGMRYPRVYVIDPTNGRVLAHTGTSLAPYGSNIAYTQGTSIATADFNSDGAQDMVIPAKEGQFLVLNGRNRAIMATIPTNLVVQNTPVITQDPGGLRVTFAGYNGNGGIVSSYTTPGGTLGNNGWPKFGRNAGLTALQGSLSGPYSQMIEGQVLRPGGVLRTQNGAYFAAMQYDGNFVLYSASHAVKFATGTRSPGAYLQLGADGNLVVRGADGSVKWQSGVRGGGFERLVLREDGRLWVYSGTWAASRRLTTSTPIWKANG
jgi:hypothetical protein